MLKNYKNILVALDGSKITDRVLDKAIDAAKRNQTHLDILNVLELKQFSDTYGNAISSDIIYNLVEDTRKQLANYKTRSENVGLNDVSVHIRFGNPKTVIAQEFPKDHNNNLIIIGQTGLNALERFMIGSVTSYVNRTAQCDVLIIK